MNKALGKFDERTDEVIFLGYSSKSKAYRVYNKVSKIVEESINVRFVEKDLDDSDDESDKNKPCENLKELQNVLKLKFLI